MSPSPIPSSLAKQPELQPRIGMIATVRNRRGVVTGVAAHDGGPEGRLHLVTIEYFDGAADDTLVWEREVTPHLVEPSALPEPDRAFAMPRGRPCIQHLAAFAGLPTVNPNPVNLGPRGL